MEAGPLQPSGRVIAGGRLLLACLFLIAIWADAGRTTPAPRATYLLLATYVAWSFALTIIVWNNWWEDARLAAPAHVIDVAVFMLMLYSTAGYNSPYFTFFIFILLAAAIRWGWKETSVTAGAIIAAYFAVGVMIGPNPGAEIERFIVRTGHLFIISAILVWFGANQWVPWRRLSPRDAPTDTVQGDGFVAALQAGMAEVGARRAIMLWRDSSDPKIELVRISREGASRSDATALSELPSLPGSLLFDQEKDRVLMHGDAGRWKFLSVSKTLPAAMAKVVHAGEGLAIPIATGTIEGLAVFQDVRDLSTDHLDVAPRVARELAVRLQEAALFAAVEEHSMAKARVAVARDLHDSVVQFLAGLGFRLEALKRSPAAKGELAAGLADLKETVMTEQTQLRAFIRGLRTGKPIPLHEMSRDCASLCELLARQWDIDCTCDYEAGPGWVSLRTQIDVQHLVREAVANAVRHGSATRVTVSLRGEKDRLRLSVSDNGTGFARPSDTGEQIEPPVSLYARVRELRGNLEVKSSAGSTTILISLPMDELA